MFTLAKLTSVALSFLTLGSAGGIITPIVLGATNFLFKEDLSKSSIDLSELEKTEEEISKKLTNSKMNYNSALQWLQKLKSMNFQRIINTFQKIFKTEDNIKLQYQGIKGKFEELIKLLTEKGEASIKKLGAEKATKSLSVLEKGLQALSKGFDGWKKEFSKIVCAINQKGGQGNCSEGSINRARRSTADLQSSEPGGGTETGSQQAKQSLEVIKSELESLIESISEMHEEATKTQAKAKTQQNFSQALSDTLGFQLGSLTAKEQILQREINLINEQVKNLLKEIEGLTGEIQNTNNEVEKLKKQLIMVKDYEGKFLNSLCSLKTIKFSECTKAVSTNL